MIARDLQRTAEVTVEAFRVMKRLLRVGMSERQIARLAGRVLRDCGAERLAFPVIAALTSNASTPHHVATGRRARVGDLLVLDMGSVVGGMRADMTRTFFFGRPRPRFVEVYQHVFEAQQRGYHGVRAGRSGTSVDAISRQYLHSVGLGKYFIHGLGHGLGRAIHQRPWLSPRKGANVLRAGQVITIEPGVYITGELGMRVEDACEVLADGARWLVPTQRHISRMILV